MKALLLYPKFPDTFWSFKHALKFIGKRASLPPLGLLTVAAMLPSSWAVRVVDVNVRTLQDTDLDWADVVLISAMIAQRESAAMLIELCHAAGKTIVAGGPLFTVDHERFSNVDHFVLNEAEATLSAFLRDFEQGRARKLYTSSELPDLRATPIPRWDLVDLRRYASMSVQYSRGCPFDCDFCSVTAMFGHRPRVKSPSQIIDELDELWRRGWRGTVFFVDDNFIGNKHSLRTELLPALIRWREGKRGFSFYTEASINLADDEALMRQMVGAAFDQVFIGIETPEEASLTECNKRQNKSRNLVADVKRIQRAGLQVQGGFIVGFDHDSPTIFQRQIDLIQQSGIVTAMVGLLQAVPGTKLHERLRLQGRLLGATTGDNVDGSTNFISQMQRETLHTGYRQLMDYLYSPGPYYRRIRTFLREYRPRRFVCAVSWRDAGAFIRAIVRLGILGREGFHFWGLLLWTGLKRPTLVPMAVTLAIYGFHFRKCCAAL